MFRVLIVDDSNDIRRNLKAIFESLGAEVSESSDGYSALEYIEREGCPDVISLDWSMPKLSGIDCLKKIRADRDSDECLILMCTAEREFEHVAQALEAGANEYIMKPFSREIIASKLKMLGVK